ncbi:hypothetical protein Pth03_45420 [Planotetraspora thailandica]|uniref:SnoaL-like domain-containing protein n=1 Tax=Planotetraspora thailandica TaxID=487172 RepID=A0A8J3V3K7_9ACTN|nr:ester cyclase [Planotetraspora thailandica]GII56153.1 hypothetical protein Pth03_45420 [Planotetraspora thailandica]
MSVAWEIKKRLYAAFNDHDMPRVVECYSPDGILVSPEGIAEGREQIATFYEHLIVGFSDVKITPWYEVDCDDPAVSEWMLTGTHTGPFLLPCGRYAEGSGNHIAVRGCCAARVDNGKITSHQHYYDQLELYSQLGFALACAPAT